MALSSAAALIKAEIGVEAVAVDVGGWDTHGNQGPVDGYMAGLMGAFARGRGDGGRLGSNERNRRPGRLYSSR